MNLPYGRSAIFQFKGQDEGYGKGTSYAVTQWANTYSLADGRILCVTEPAFLLVRFLLILVDSSLRRCTGLKKLAVICLAVTSLVASTK